MNIQFSGLESRQKHLDYKLTIAALISSFFGLLLIFSATHQTESALRNILVQSLCLGLGVLLMVVISRFDYELYYDLSKYIVVILCIALIVTFFIAKDTKGNRNWVNLGIINIQTSEIAKVGFIATFSAHLNHVRSKINHPKTLLFLVLHFAAYAVPIILQGDIGSLLIYLVMFVFMLFAARLHVLYFLGGGALCVALVPILWKYVLKDYMISRILITFNPYLDPLGDGYQSIQSMVALGSGKMNGNGLFQGIQTQYGLLPEKHTDFIFSVAGEELGFIGCIFIIALLVYIINRIVKIGIKSENFTGFMVCIGTGIMIFAQAFESIGMCSGIMPVIGITLPFFSYGGSSLISIFMCLGLVQAVARGGKHGLKFYDEY